ncbi:hypothetical protein [Pelagicoccus albus]|uniref:Formyl transferase N-terminal domain-containing protein n=1 Tax=Pelagicoccus albus TaxID=415222 RepID=A0A7X1B5C7_9BACT|nr:hypothetical protein [Pelagicoccus albus]MBC2605948.1 hypothetical protein [Pelagicoccus albus]
MYIEPKNKKLNVLFVADKNLGYQGLEIVENYFENVTIVVWDIKAKDSLLNKTKIRNIIRSQQWDVCISFYSDFIFDDEDISHMRLPLNIHPALPSLPGVGYDVLPIVENHDYFGVTLHHIIRKIDGGMIFDVLKKGLPENMTYSELRKGSQILCLKMLRKTSELIYQENSLESIRRKLEAKSKELNAKWSGKYTSRKQLRELLEKIEGRDPSHLVFK